MEQDWHHNQPNTSITLMLDIDNESPLTEGFAFIFKFAGPPFILYLAYLASTLVA